MKNYYNVSIALLLMTFLGFSAIAQSEESLFAFDRGTQNYAASAVSKGSLLIETGYDYSSFDDEFRVHVFGNSVLRYGLSEKLELRIGGSYMKSKYEYVGGWWGFPTQEKQTEISEGFGPLLLGGKFSVAKQHGFVPDVGLVLDVKIGQTGADAFYIDKYISTLVAAAGYRLSSYLNVGVNMGFVIDKSWEEESFVYGISLTGTPMQKLGVFVEYVGGSLNASSHNQFGAGITYLLMKNLQFDVSGAWGSDIIYDWFYYGVGLSYGFGGRS